MTQTDLFPAWPEPKPTALLVLADGTVLEGFGLGASGHAEFTAYPTDPLQRAGTPG